MLGHEVQAKLIETSMLTDSSLMELPNHGNM